MAEYTVPIHGNGATQTGAYNDSPSISATVIIGTITRSGSTINVPIKATLNYLGGYSWFGYAINVRARVDSGSMSTNLIEKPSSNSYRSWDTGSWGTGEQTISSTNTGSTTTLHVYMASDCPCNGSETNFIEVWSKSDISVPAYQATVTFDPRGGTWNDGTTSNKTVTVNIGNAATITAPTKTNYNFTGWNSKSDGTGTDYGTSGVSNVQSNVTVYAQWEKVTYQVSFNNNGGSGSMSAVNVESGISYTIPECKFTGPSYTLIFDAQGGTVNGSATYSVQLTRPFSSWNTKADGTGTTYTVGKPYSILSAITLYAIWGSPTIGTLYEPVYENTEFIGWFDGTGVNANQVYETTKVTTNNTTIYAHYNYYIVYYYNTEGSSSGDYDPDDDPDMGTDLGVFTSGIKSYGIAYAIISDYPKNIPEKEFASWNTDPEGLGTRYIAGDSYTEDAPLNLYARYDLGKYTVIFDANKGQFNDGSSQKKYTNVEAGSGVTPPEDPTRKGHKFLGWLGNYTRIVQDTTIKAMWTYYPIWIRNKDNEWEGYR